MPSDIARDKLCMKEFLKMKGLALALVAKPDSESTASPEPESQPALELLKMKPSLSRIALSRGNSWNQFK